MAAATVMALLARHPWAPCCHEHMRQTWDLWHYELARERCAHHRLPVFEAIAPKQSRRRFCPSPPSVVSCPAGRIEGGVNFPDDQRQ